MVDSKNRKPIQVLLVEDERRYVAEIAACVEDLNRTSGFDAGIALEFASSLRSAIEHLNAYFVDVILLDLSLPDVQGITAIQEISQRFPNVPIVVLTNLSNWGSMIRSADAGGRDFLVKNGLEPETLRRVVYHTHERKQADVRLRQAIDVHQTFLDNLPVGAFRKDLFGRYLFVNQVFCNIVGYEAADIVNHGDRELFSGHSAQLLVSEDRDLISSKQLSKLNTQLKTAEGKSFHAEIVKMPILSMDGEVEGIQGTLNDVTGRQKTDDQQHIVDRFAGMEALSKEIVHQVKNRLAPVSLNASILESKCESPDMIKLCREIKQATTKSGETVQHLLMFSEENTTVKMPVDLELVLAELSRFVKRNAPRGVDFSVHAAPNLASIEADFASVRKLLEALCKNAWESMDSDGRITVTVKNSISKQLNSPTAPGSRVVLIRVQDTGNGIPPEIRDRIFDPYFTTKDPEQFLGMGLTSSMATVRGLQGSIRVKSDQMQGSCFDVTLPALESNSNPTSSESRQGSGQTILLVDDEGLIISTGKTFLEGKGFQVITATDGADGIGKFTRHSDQIDLVITDLMMPHMDGAELSKAIRNQAPLVPILVATGLEVKENLERLEGLGIAGILSKPFSPEKLLSLILDQLGD